MISADPKQSVHFDRLRTSLNPLEAARDVVFALIVVSEIGKDEATI
jgi:hypothetical protein